MSNEGQKVVNGTPSAVFLPPRPYKWNHVKGPIQLVVPLRGKYDDFFPHLKEELSSAPSGEFDCFYKLEEEGERKVHVLDYSQLIGLLFVTRQYLGLPDNQVFSLSSVIIDEEINEVKLIGHVLERIG